MKQSVYLDNNATTQVDPRVVEAMLPYFTTKFGNAASRNHAFGWEAEAGVDTAREQVAQVIGADSKEIIFTSGATESNNIAIKGVAAMYGDKGRHIITQKTEHKAVLDPCQYLAEKHGFRVTVLEVDAQGLIDLQQLRAAMTDDTVLVSIMHGNNEIGTLQPITEIGRLCKERGVLFHTDACQTFGKVPIDVEAMGIDLLSCSAHKIHGPKGVGALYVRRKRPRVRCEAVLHGGGHERGMRSGTLNVPGIVGLGRAAELCREGLANGEVQRMAQLRDRLFQRLSSRLSDINVNGHPTARTPSNLNVSFAFVEGESLMMGFSEIAVSSGSACTSASLEPSYVLKALGVGDELAHSSIRFSLGRFTTQEEIDYTADRVVAAVEHLRKMSPLAEMAAEGIDLKTVEWAHH
ncbi:MAG: IscS subfamily cysteine desulfurase [Planctomycetia bacterium]|nr:MAG: IscS subfamily cysteine desulfurase [Planctomycetia bacterium]